MGLGPGKNNQKYVNLQSALKNIPILFCIPAHEITLLTCEPFQNTDQLNQKICGRRVIEMHPTQFLFYKKKDKQIWKILKGICK